MLGPRAQFSQVGDVLRGVVSAPKQLDGAEGGRVAQRRQGHPFGAAAFLRVGGRGRSLFPPASSLIVTLLDDVPQVEFLKALHHAQGQGEHALERETTRFAPWRKYSFRASFPQNDIRRAGLSGQKAKGAGASPAPAMHCRNSSSLLKVQTSVLCATFRAHICP